MSEIENDISIVAEPSVDPNILEEMAKAGVLYGRKKSKTHPRMKSYIFATRNGIEIFDLIKVFSEIEKAQEFLKNVIKKGGTIMVVSTLPASKSLVKDLAKKFGFPYVTERWLGGTLTNFQTLSKRIKHYLDLKSDKELGKLAKYTKKEQSQFDKEIERLTHLFSGLETLTQIPDAVLIMGATEHQIAIREAKILNIPIIAVTNSDTNPDTLDYPIPANSRSKSSISWILNKLEESIQIGINEKGIVKEIVKEKEEAPKNNGGNL